jgi:translation initiation factor 2 alpha subunit (eIF-2alpha)
MRVIRKYVDVALKRLQDKIETVKEKLWNAFDRMTELLGRSGNPEIRRLNESFEEAMSDLSDQQLFSARKLLSDETKKRRFEQHHR